MRPHRPRRPFMKPNLYRRFRSAARRASGDDEVDRMLSEADRYARSRPSFRSAMAAMKRSLFDGLVKALGPLGDLVKALLRPGGRRLADENKELKGLSNLVEAIGPEARGRSTPTRERQKTEEELREILESQGFKTTGPPTGSHVAPSPSGRGSGSRRPPRSTDPGEFEEWEGPEPRSVASNVIELNVGGSVRRFKANDPMVTGEMIPVQSSNVHSIGFALDWGNPAKSALKVQFKQSGPGTKKGGPGPLYYYYGVHPDLFLRFRLAASKGKFVWDKLRVRGTVSGHQYHYELKGVSGGYVPRRATRFGGNEYYVGRSLKSRSLRTGEVRTLRSKLPDRFVGSYKPQTGRPNRGRPNRGR